MSPWNGPNHGRFPLTGVRPFVYLEVLAAREHFPAAGKRALERPLAGVHADVVDELVLGLERPAVAAAAEPAARVVRLLGAADVLDCQVNDGVLDAGERPATRSGRRRRRRRRRLVLDGRRRPAQTDAVVARRRTRGPETGQRLLRITAAGHVG